MERKDLQAYLQDSAREKVTDFTKDGACSCCGECCKDIIIADHNEIWKIKKFVKQHGICPQPHPIGVNTLDMTCPFLCWDTHMCAIYPVRPKICKEFICSKSDKEIDEMRERIANQGVVLSLRKEIFGDDRHIKMLSAAIMGWDGFCKTIR